MLRSEQPSKCVLYLIPASSLRTMHLAALRLCSHTHVSPPWDIMPPALTTPANLQQGLFQGNGGAIYTNGEVVVEGKSTFTDNASAVSDAVDKSAMPWLAHILSVHYSNT